MKRVLIIAIAALSVMSLSIPAASAETTDPMAALYEALDEAQHEVDRLTILVGTLQDELAEAEKAVTDAEGDLQHAENAVTSAEIALGQAEQELDAAFLVRDTLLGTIAANVNPNGECTAKNGGQTGKEACEAAKAAVSGANQAVTDAEQSVGEAREDLAAAEQAVEDAMKALDDATGIRDDRIRDLEQARIDLAAAGQTLVDAQQAILDATPPPVEVVKHPGCKGIENAQAQVVSNAKGKAPAALAIVAAKLNCAA